ncbi:cysteine hydrolase family protein [Campylobacter geochelonis]|uniref:Amidase n=1 Tax=Campylobacter geochelonis TaxID=1780362 RepID=A0A128EKP4_9BACT|nr:isochorismatase family cysteine hydrolase [Campylobacter geochelonis]QKF71185.1 pyrazinamidase / nicotinamidase [Campylobacter geochelonis]CZE48793.1 amidase [Campylobacter geochelonis]CZE48825.1 amidase [Campylobacter geochelonis]CZE50003.1 amidase [Campylobacter geochelonis]
MKKLLVVVDFQNDFVDGALGFEDAKKIEDEIYTKITAYERANDDVVFTLDTHDEDYLQTIEGQNLPIKHCIKGSFGWEIYGKVKELSKNHPNLVKHTFGCDLLMKFIQEKPYKYDTIELVGLVSNICVVSNAIIAKSASPLSQVTVDAKATSSYDKVIQEKTFDVLENLHIKVLNRA